MMFRVVLCLVPRLFYVKRLETKDVPRFHVFLARTRTQKPAGGFTSLMREPGRHGTRRTRGTGSVFNSVSRSTSLLRHRTDVERQDSFKMVLVWQGLQH